MAKFNHHIRHNSILRAVFVGISLLFQIGWIILRVQWLNDYSEIISIITVLLSILIVLKLNSKNTNSAMKMPWIMLILALPVLGLCLYLLFELLGDPGIGKRLQKVQSQIHNTEEASAAQAFSHLKKQNPIAASQGRYLWKQAGCPVYENTDVIYFSDTCDALNSMKQALEQAEQFIFMEYFIVEDESAFRELEAILVRKAQQGVEVRVLYDDIGSVGKVNMLFAKGLKDKGIRCMPFNPALPILNLFMNHRDHRKITVIDGKVGFTGGYNLAEEYFNRTHPYGMWKDTGIRMEGEAVRSLTATFLELWHVQTKEPVDSAKYLEIQYSVPAQGFVQPFGDNPLGEERVAENVYLNLIQQSQKKLYIMTPYLIITDEMQHALGMAAMRGVDVRILTPGIPDKRTVFAVTRSYYTGLVRQGVRIYEYAPGFCHGKQCLCDDRMASIGTSNLDYRSLYHHFENNVLLIDCDAVGDMAEDFDRIFLQSTEVTNTYMDGKSSLLDTWQYILRLFAPLL